MNFFYTCQEPGRGFSIVQPID